MSKCEEIKAYVRMEERYEGLNLIFGDCPDLKKEILAAIEVVKKETGMTPFIYDKVSNDRPDLQAIYVEFHDDVHRTGGDFFTRLLKKLDIDKCEDNLC
ncbi:MAG: hypothetical protein U9Q90_04400 [Campylobacterota bacterium]|nr:hypothetical protein [Campylobacterota bacterium]